MNCIIVKMIIMNFIMNFMPFLTLVVFQRLKNLPTFANKKQNRRENQAQ